MVIVVVSDVHLGYTNSDAKSFSNFLDDLILRKDVDTVILLGDIVDMWRRDISGLFLAFHDILEKILELKRKVNVYAVAGNHDFHMLKLTSPDYPLQFQREITLAGDGITYQFKHGWEFDMAQQEPAMELLCHNMSDAAGNILSEAWSGLQSLGKIPDDLRKLFEKHNGGDNYLKHLMKSPGDRLGPDMGEVEKRANANVTNYEILIFGHTHRPFVSSRKNLANCGSWVTDEKIYNTYVEIDGKEIHLMQYGKGEITDKLISDF